MSTAGTADALGLGPEPPTTPTRPGQPGCAIGDLVITHLSQMLYQVLDRTAQGVVVMGLDDGRVHYANTAAGQALAATPIQLQGRVFTDFLPHGLRRRCLRGWEDITTADYRWEGRLPLRRFDGGRFLARGHIGVVADASGEPRHVFAVFSDHAAERERHALLIKARRDAEHASQAKTTFLSHTSHELRTPMNAILGFAQLLDLYAHDGQQRGWIKEIVRASQHLTSLIDEILDLSRIESGNDVLRMQLVDLSAICRECLSLLTPLMLDKRLRTDGDGLLAPMMVMADRVRLKQVVLNLMSNAVKFSHEGGTLRIRIQMTEGEAVRLSIEDEGPGIAPAQMTRLFEPFNRLGADDRGIPGTGIGLAISKRLVERMHGRIAAHSVLGQGSVFSITFKAVMFS
ncbi:MAG: PAS domain-containing sensor histidine kinase [Aquabacterium sp.]